MDFFEHNGKGLLAQTLQFHFLLNTNPTTSPLNISYPNQQQKHWRKNKLCLNWFKKHIYMSQELKASLCKSFGCRQVSTTALKWFNVYLNSCSVELMRLSKNHPFLAYQVTFLNQIMGVTLRLREDLCQSLHYCFSLLKIECHILFQKLFELSF